MPCTAICSGFCVDRLRFRQEPLLNSAKRQCSISGSRNCLQRLLEQIIPMILAMEFGKQNLEMAEQRQAAAEASALADAIFKRCNPLKRFCMKYLLHLI
ncbi:MAG: hypothetical protein ACLSFT_03570 [Ruminococcus callidus]